MKKKMLESYLAERLEYHEIDYSSLTVNEELTGATIYLDNECSVRSLIDLLNDSGIEDGSISEDDHHVLLVLSLGDA